MKLNPIVNGGPAHEEQFILVQIKEDRVTDDISIVITSDELLGFVDSEILETINAGGRDQFERLRALDPHVCHMVGLVEKNAGLLPGTLFISPIRELGRNHGIDIRTQLGTTQHLYGIPDALYQFV
jgi:hypothetical protein